MRFQGRFFIECNEESINFTKQILSILFDKNLLFIDGDLWLWWPITGVSRIKVNQLRIPLMPGGWGMMSNTFQNLLKERGFSNLESGYNQVT